MPDRKDAPSFRDLVGGVKPLPESALPPVVPSDLPERPSRIPSIPVSAPSLTVTRAEEYVEAHAPGVNERTLAKLRRGEFAPQQQLDLHGLTAHAANTAVGAFLRAAHARHSSTVLIIHGQGRHSGHEGPVLQQVVIDCLLSEHRALVVAFCTAPGKWGGKGALVVRLRKS